MDETRLTRAEESPPAAVIARERAGSDGGRSRRDFLRAAGLGGIALAFPELITACSEATAPTRDASSPTGATSPVTAAATGGVTLDFSNDLGVLNFAYALEQLEAAFYVQVIKTPYSGITARESTLLTDVRDHEVAHRDFFMAALGTNGIGAVTPNFSSVDFSSRASVLGTAQAFEDLGVSAYNGAAHYLKNTTYLVVAGKIVSVEARHASAIRDLIQPRTGYFAPAAFDPARAPTDVLTIAGPYISTPITIINS